MRVRVRVCVRVYACGCTVGRNSYLIHEKRPTLYEKRHEKRPVYVDSFSCHTTMDTVPVCEGACSFVRDER